MNIIINKLLNQYVQIEQPDTELIVNRLYSVTAKQSAQDQLLAEPKPIDEVIETIRTALGQSKIALTDDLVDLEEDLAVLKLIQDDKVYRIRIITEIGLEKIG